MNHSNQGQSPYRGLHFTRVLHVLLYKISKLYFKCNFWDWILILRPNMTHIIIKLYFLHEDLDYNKKYNFVFNHDDKFLTFLTIKDI